jgi:hypothetical protein
VRLRADDLCAAAWANSEDYENVGRVWRCEARMGRLARCGPRLHGQPCARASDGKCARPQTYSVVWRARCVLLFFLWIATSRSGTEIVWGLATGRAMLFLCVCAIWIDRCRSGTPRRSIAIGLLFFFYRSDIVCVPREEHVNSHQFREEEGDQRSTQRTRNPKQRCRKEQGS